MWWNISVVEYGIFDYRGSRRGGDAIYTRSAIHRVEYRRGCICVCLNIRGVDIEIVQGGRVQ